MLDLSNEQVVKECYEYASQEMSGFFGSSEYSKAWDRYKVRRDAFYRNSKDSKSFKSKIYLATYYNGVITLDAQFKSAHASDPFIFVKAADNSNIDPEATEKALLAHEDLNYNLQTSRFKVKLFDMYRHLLLSGCMVGREIVRSIPTQSTIRKASQDRYAITQPIQSNTMVKREEMSITDVIHPLNHAHQITRNSFIGSSWAGVRYELSKSDLYRMLKTGKGYAPGIKNILENTSSHGLKTVTASKEHYYSELGAESSMINNNTFVVHEYSGPLYCDGNEYDDDLYLVLTVPDYHEVIWIGKNPYNRHPYWKASAYPDPDGPFGIDPCSTLLPINAMENHTVNAFMDYMNTALKALYEVIPGNIQGGLLSLIKGFPNGFIPLNEGIEIGRTIQPANLGRQGLPPVTEVMNWLQAFKQEYGPSSNLRGKGSEVKNADTATGISLLAEREDTIVQAMQDSIDLGLTDAMMLKLQLNEFMGEPKEANVKYKEEQEYTRVQYYPWELVGQDYTYKINREIGDKRAGKYMSFIKLILGLDQLLSGKGVNLPPDFIVDMLGDVGQSLGIDGIDEKIKKLKNSSMAPQINSMVPHMGTSMPQSQQQTQLVPQIPSQGALANAAMAMA